MPIAGRDTVTDHALANHVVIVISPMLVSGVLLVPPSLVSAHGLTRLRKLVLTSYTKEKEAVRKRLTEERWFELQIYNVAKQMMGHVKK